MNSLTLSHNCELITSTRSVQLSVSSMDAPQQVLHQHLDSFAAFLREHGMDPIQFISVHNGDAYWTVVFRTNYCPICKRRHERQNNFFKQYKRSEPVFVSGEEPRPPRAYVGCYQAEFTQNSVRVHPWIYIEHLWDNYDSNSLRSWGITFIKASQLYSWYQDEASED